MIIRRLDSYSKFLLSHGGCSSLLLFFGSIQTSHEPEQEKAFI